MPTINHRAIALLGLVAVSIAPFAASASSQRTILPAPNEAPRASTATAPRFVVPSWENNNATALAPFLSGQTLLERSGATGGNGQGS